MQLIVVVFLGYKILHKKNNVLGSSIKVNTINRNEIVYTPDQKLRYFFEPVPKSTQTDKRNWMEKEVKYTINQAGFNDRFDYPIVKPPKTIRIMTLGDSFTFGVYVNTEDNWTELLEDKLNSIKNICPNTDHFEVINLGVGGYDIEYAAKRYINRGKVYNPNIILWFLKYDDINAINEWFFPLERKISEEMKLDRSSEEYVVSKDGVPYPSWVKGFEEFHKKYGMNSILSYEKNVLNKFNENYQGNLAIFTSDNSDSETKNEIKSFSRLSPNGHYFEIPGLSSDETFPDNHPNQKGHKVISDAILNYMVKNPDIFCH